MVRVESHLAVLGKLRKRVSPLTSDLESRTLESQDMPSFASEAACLRQELSEAQKEADVQRAKLASLGYVIEEDSKIKKDVSNLLSSFTQTREHRINQKALVQTREFKIVLLKDPEKTLDRHLAFVKMSCLT